MRAGPLLLAGHVYLLAYGTFRGAHTPVSGDQLLALGLIALGVQGFLRVQRCAREVV
jgi:hypothetical protein